MKLRVVLSVLLLSVHARVYGANTNGFPPLETVMDTDAAGQLPNTNVYNNVRLWLFPSMTFSCSGNVTQWIFQAESSDDGTELPRMQVWRKISISVDGVYYLRQSTSGSEGELSKVGATDSVYKYVLESPVPVEEEDIFGVSLPPAVDSSLLLQFQDFGPEGLPLSYVTPATGTILFVSQLGLDFQFLPLVTAIIVTPEGTVSVHPTLATPPVASPSASTPPAMTPPPSSDPLPPTGNGNDGGGSNGGGSNGSGSNGGIIAAAVICSVLGVLVVCAVVIAIIIVIMKRRQPGIYEVKRAPNRMDNPVYTGVVSGMDNNRQTTKSNSSAGSYHIYAMPSEPLASRHRGGGERHIPNNNRTTPTADKLVAEHYEFPEGIRTPEPHGYYEVEIEESTKSATLASQYEVPVSSTMSSELSREEAPRDHVYSVLEGSLYVPTEEQRKSLTATSNGSSIFDNSDYARWGKKGKGQFFKQEEIYWKPASSKTALYDQLARRKYREILRPQIQVIEHLGAGQFGTVNKGLWQAPEGTMDVAVKTLQPGISEEDKVKFLQEAAIMGQFLHPNVVKLHGVVTVGEPTMIVLEFMPKGDLRNYLKSRRPQPGEMVPADTPDLLLRFCKEIASGMNYLSNKAFVHRDLAARNILVAEDKTCKIGDFGMSRDLADNNYYITHGGKIPVKWTAPEALHFRKYSTASDVWSYGALMYEIWSLGHKPFDGYTNQQAMQLIGSGFRLSPPPGCPRPLYGLMIRCWHKDAEVRPTFSAIVNMLSHSHSHLLRWMRKDEKTHPQASCIGAPLSAGEELYPDLQDYYMDDQSKRLTQ